MTDSDALKKVLETSREAALLSLRAHLLGVENLEETEETAELRERLERCIEILDGPLAEDDGEDEGEGADAPDAGEEAEEDPGEEEEVHRVSKEADDALAAYEKEMEQQRALKSIFDEAMAMMGSASGEEEEEEEDDGEEIDPYGDDLVRMGKEWLQGAKGEVDYENAYSCLQEAAERDHPEGMFLVGALYAKGLGQEKDPETAAYWYEMAANEGHGAAEYFLALSYLKREDRDDWLEEARDLAERAAEHGYARGRELYAFLCRDDCDPAEWDDSRDDPLGAIGGKEDSARLCKLGDRYYNGKGAPFDPAEGLKWYRKAADLGDANGQFKVGFAYHDGDDVTIKQDFAEARKWYAKAAAQGHPEAAYYLARLYQDGSGGEKDPGKAFDLFLQAAEAGHLEAQYEVGCLYRDGEGVEEDYDEARRWLEKAALRGHGGAMEALSEMA